MKTVTKSMLEFALELVIFSIVTIIICLGCTYAAYFLLVVL